LANGLNMNEIAEKLFNQFSDKLYAFATKIWKFSEDEAWDTIYETIFHIAKVYHRYDFPEEKSLRNFVITVFNNRLRNRYRNKKNEPITVELGRTGESQIDLEVQTTQSEAEKAVSDALAELEDWERILLVQRSLLVPYSEIQKLTDKPEHQLKVYYKRALEKLENKVREKLSLETKNGKSI
jgi:RNA polymerase sigma factor (sigma-70 family)